MLHKLTPISIHPTYQMQEILLAVVDAAVNDIEFSQDIFPQVLQDNWTTYSILVEKLESVLYAYVNNLQDKVAFRDEFLNNNNIRLLCNDSSVNIISTINWEIEENLKKFFLYCYSVLDSKMYCNDQVNEKARKEYDELFRAVNKYVCPFCGLNQYPNVNATQRADFDHYIYKGDYPLSSANMENLVPMCVECNRDVKKTKNILFNNSRTYAFYPYDDIPEINFELLCLQEPTMDFNNKGEWSILITPNITNNIIEQKIETWDRVFNIKQRYINDIKEFHEEWILSALDDKFEEFEDVAALKVFFETKVSSLNRMLQRKMEQKVYIKIIFFKFMHTTASNRFLNRFLQSHNNKLNA